MVAFGPSTLLLDFWILFPSRFHDGGPIDTLKEALGGYR